MTESEDLGDRIDAYCVTWSITNAEFAIHAGVSAALISRAHKGTPSPRYLRLIETALQTPHRVEREGPTASGTPPESDKDVRARINELQARQDYAFAFVPAARAPEPSEDLPGDALASCGENLVLNQLAIALERLKAQANSDERDS